MLPHSKSFAVHLWTTRQLHQPHHPYRRVGIDYYSCTAGWVIGKRALFPYQEEISEKLFLELLQLLLVFEDKSFCLFGPRRTCLYMRPCVDVLIFFFSCDCQVCTLLGSGSPRAWIEGVILAMIGSRQRCRKAVISHVQRFRKKKILISKEKKRGESQPTKTRIKSKMTEVNKSRLANVLRNIC